MMRIMGFPNMVVLSFIGLFFLVAMFIVLVWALVDCISSNKPVEEKLLWILLIIFFNIVGVVLYALLGTKDSKTIKIKSMSKNKKVLIRDTDNEMIAGICSGLGKYFDVDVTIVRLIFVVLLFLTSGSFLLVYLIGALIIPAESDVVLQKKESSETNKSKKKESKEGYKPRKKKSNALVILLIVLFIVVPIIISGIVAIGFVTYSVSPTEYGGSIRTITESVIVSDNDVKVTIDSLSHHTDLVKTRIVEGYNYNEHNGHNLLFLQNYRPDRSECISYKGDPFGMRIYEDNCMRLKFRFDVDTDKLPDNVIGFYVDALVIRNEIKEISFEERIY